MHVPYPRCLQIIPITAPPQPHFITLHTWHYLVYYSARPLMTVRPLCFLRSFFCGNLPPWCYILLMTSVTVDLSQSMSQYTNDLPPIVTCYSHSICGLVSLACVLHVFWLRWPSPLFFRLQLVDLAWSRKVCARWCQLGRYTLQGSCGPEPSITTVVLAEYLHKWEGGETAGGVGGPEDTVDGHKQCDWEHFWYLWVQNSHTPCETAISNTRIGTTSQERVHVNRLRSRTRKSREFWVWSPGKWHHISISDIFF